MLVKKQTYNDVDLGKAFKIIPKKKLQMRETVILLIMFCKEKNNFYFNQCIDQLAQKKARLLIPLRNPLLCC